MADLAQSHPVLTMTALGAGLGGLTGSILVGSSVAFGLLDAWAVKERHGRTVKPSRATDRERRLVIGGCAVAGMFMGLMNGYYMNRRING